MVVSIEITNLSKKYGYSYALNNVNLKVTHGEVVGLLGPNGSGKTTLLKILATLTSPTSGVVREYGLNIQEDGRSIRRIVGYLAHEPLLYKDLTGEENVHFYSQFYQQPSRDDFEKTLTQTLDFLGIARWRHEPVKNLSSGLRKRFDLVRTLIHDPKILLFDEPFSNLDVLSVQILQNYINAARNSKTVIISTHNFNHAKELCDRVVILLNGKICRILDSSDISVTIVQNIFDGGTSGE